MRVPIAEVKAHALDRVEQICDTLIPGGHRSGNCYMAKNPTRGDKRAGSFVVWLNGPARGAFKEFCAGEDEKGDVIDLVSYVLAGGASFKDRTARGRALEWLADFCNLDRMPDQARRAALEAARRRESERAGEAERAAQKQARAFKMWGAGRALFGTIAETYLKTRGIPLAEIQNLETDLRFLDRQEYWLGRERNRDGSTRMPGPAFPVMIGAFRDLAGRFTAVHVTYLAPDGSGKAPVSKPKLIWPAYAGSVIRLTRGESNLTPEEATERGVTGPVQIYEGAEDGLSGALCAPQIRSWAAGALSNFQNVPALPCVDAFMLHRQNDWHSRAAVTAFDHARAALEATGRPIAEIAAFGDAKDINDMVRT